MPRRGGDADCAAGLTSRSGWLGDSARVTEITRSVRSMTESVAVASTTRATTQRNDPTAFDWSTAEGRPRPRLPAPHLCTRRTKRGAPPSTSAKRRRKAVRIRSWNGCLCLAGECCPCRQGRRNGNAGGSRFPGRSRGKVPVHETQTSFFFRAREHSHPPPTEARTIQPSSGEPAGS